MSDRTATDMALTRLPAAFCSPGARTEIGAMAISDSFGNSCFDSRYFRSAPPMIAMTASLTVAPSTAFLMARMSFNRKDRPSKTRCGET